MDLIAVILPLVVLRFCCSTCDCDLRIIDQLFFRICSMSLCGDCIYIIRSFRRIQTFDDLISENFIFCPAQRVLIIFLCHIFSRSESIKSKVRKDTSSSVEVCLIIMHCMSAVSKILQDIWCAFAGCLFQNTLVRIFSRSKIMKAHTCD